MALSIALALAVLGTTGKATFAATTLPGSNGTGAPSADNRHEHGGPTALLPAFLERRGPAGEDDRGGSDARGLGTHTAPGAAGTSDGTSGAGMPWNEARATPDDGAAMLEHSQTPGDSVGAPRMRGPAAAGPGSEAEAAGTAPPTEVPSGARPGRGGQVQRGLDDAASMQEPGGGRRGSRARTSTTYASNYPSVLHTCEELGAITESVQSPARIYAASFYTWLHESTYQWLIALIGAFIGACCVWDGAGVWEALFTAGVAAMAAGITRYEAEHWALAASQVTKAGLMLQAAIAVAVAVHGGFEGFQVLFGFLVGILGAHSWNNWAGDFESWMPGHTLLWHTMGAILGVLVLTMWRKPVLSTLAPLFGGLLVTSGVGCLASYTWAALSGAGSVGPFLPSPKTPWYAAAVDLLGGGGLVVHCICAVCALVLHSYSAERRIPAIICLILCILVTMVTSALCGDANRGLRCPSWVAESRGWLWRSLGCIVWAIITAAAAWRQLGLLQDWGAHRFWKGYFDKAARRFRYMELPEAEQESPREATMYPGEGNVSSRSFRDPQNRVLVQDLQDSYRHRPRRHHHNNHSHHNNDANPNSSAAHHPDGAP